MALHRREQIMAALADSLSQDAIAAKRVWRDLDRQQFETQTGARTMVILRQGAEEIVEMSVGSIVDARLQVEAFCISSGDPAGEAGTSASTNLNALCAAVVKTILAGPSAGPNAGDAHHGCDFITDISEIGTEEIDAEEAAQFPWATLAIQFEVHYRRSRTDPTG